MSADGRRIWRGAVSQRVGSSISLQAVIRSRSGHQQVCGYAPAHPIRLIDEHLTSTIQIDDKSIEDYYNQTLLPQLRQKGAKEPSLAEVTPKIRELLTQRKLNDALKDWMQSLRDSSTIVLKTEGASK